MTRSTPWKPVAITEIARIGGVSRQRAWQITQNKCFPKPVAELEVARLWDRHEVEVYFTRTRPRDEAAEAAGAREET